MKYSTTCLLNELTIICITKTININQIKKGRGGGELREKGVRERERERSGGAGDIVRGGASL